MNGQILPRGLFPYVGARWCFLADHWVPLDDAAVEFGPYEGRPSGSVVCLAHDRAERSPRQNSLLHRAEANLGTL